MRVLISHEESGVMRDAFIARGHDAMSCDFLPSATPGPHYQGDYRDVLGRGWDLWIAHPVCRYLCNSGAKHLYRGMKKGNGRCPDRWAKMEADAREFKSILEDDTIPMKAVENSIMHGRAKTIIGMEQTQIVQPHWFGHKQMKATCWWLFGLPKLVKTNDVGPPPTDPEERKKWADVHRCPPGPERSKIRSRTFPGMADAAADQWRAVE